MIYSHQIVIVACAGLMACLALIQIKQGVGISIFVGLATFAALFHFMVRPADKAAERREAEAELNWNNPGDGPAPGRKVNAWQKKQMAQTRTKAPAKAKPAKFPRKSPRKPTIEPELPL